MNDLRIGFNGYSNAFPVYYPFFNNFYDWESEIKVDIPSVLNQGLVSGELDAGALSTFTYGEHSGLFYLMDEVCLHSRGYVHSVLLLSPCPMEDLGGRTICLTGASATSTNILRIILQETGIKPAEFKNIPIDQPDLPESEPVLLIGAPALTIDKESFAQVYDLAETWKKLFDRDIIFSVWAVRRDSWEKHPEDCRRIVSLLQKAPRDAFAQEEAFLENAKMLYSHVPIDLKKYYDALGYEFTPEKKEDMEFYFQKCAECGLLPNVPEIQWIPA